MTKKKNRAVKSATTEKPNAPARKSGSKKVLLIAALAVLVVAGAFAISRGGGGGGAAGAATPSAEEAKYLGRFLPDGYQEPKVSEGGAVAADTPMTPIEAKAEGEVLSIPLADVIAKRNVAFQYTKDDGSAIAMIAYVKPSGKLFLGVSYCVPCQGTGQTLTIDGALTCDSCGTKRDPESGVGLSGPCKLYPLDELPVKLEGDNVLVDKAALEGWTVQPNDRPVGG